MKTIFLLIITVILLSFSSIYGSEVASGPTEIGDWDQSQTQPNLTLIPTGEFNMGDHHDLGGAEHANDEIPIHAVKIDSFYIGTYEITNQQYCNYLNAAIQAGQIHIIDGVVFNSEGADIYFETYYADGYSRIEWDGGSFAIRDNKADHPVTSVRWCGAAAYCNWLSIYNGYEGCYDPLTWQCDFTKNGYRLPTEAQWEFAARGGQYDPYWIYPWGDDADYTKANWPNSDDPYETGSLPLTTPVGFYNGTLRQKADFNWPGAQDGYQTADGSNSFGLYDTAGNVWEWVNDWYNRDYYSISPYYNPPGPDAGSLMPDGNFYHCLRGGNWYNGAEGHSRASNRNPAYYRGPQDPDHPWYHIGFRVVLVTNASPNNCIVTDTQHTPFSPQDGQFVWVTATVTDDIGVDEVMLSYAIGGSVSGDEIIVFSESMGAEAVKPWTGDDCDNLWTVTAVQSANLEQRTQANYGDGNPCGLEFGTGTNDENDAMIETTDGISAIGSSGYVEFWLWSNSLEETDGWTFQLDSGDGFVTRISELDGSNHDWQLYHYDLLTNELVNDLKMRFQFRAGDQGDRIRLDSIIVTVAAGSNSIDVAMADDGLHNDGAAGDNVYGGQIPAQPEGTSVYYYITAIDNDAQITTDPSNAPDSTYAYTVTSNTQVEKTVGLIYSDRRAQPGYTLFAPKHNTVTYLIDNEGREINSWQSQYEPGQSVYLLENGHLLYTCFTHGALTGGGEGGRIEEYGWDGNLLWEFDYASSDYISHHDIEPLPNGNILMLVVEKKSYAEVIAAGFDPSLLHSTVQSKGYMLPDSVVEIAPFGANGGNVVWQWHIWDHLIQDFDASQDNFDIVADHPELVDVNGWVEGKNGIMPFWNHMNSIDYNADLDQIMLSVRGNSELWVIDHSTTSAQAAGHAGGRYGVGGDLLYRWGNPTTYDRGAITDQMLFDQHDAQWIEEGRPGAGNMLIFNNGLGRNYSSVDEIAPPVDEFGRYSRETNLAFGPTELTWTYTATPPTDMFSEAISGVQRLPNGNTLICDGVHGEFLEVTSDGQTVWNYINPVVKTEILVQGETPELDVRGHQYNAVFKIHRYALDYPGLTDKDLTPGNAIEGCTLTGNIGGVCGVDIYDFSLFSQQWLTGNCDNCNGADLTGDGSVNMGDLSVLASQWLAGF